jgi:hypothetical protein
MEARARDTLLAVDTSVKPPPVVDMIVMENPLGEAMVEMGRHLRGMRSEEQFECPIRAAAEQNLRHAVPELETRDAEYRVVCRFIVIQRRRSTTRRPVVRVCFRNVTAEGQDIISKVSSIAYLSDQRRETYVNDVGRNYPIFQHSRVKQRYPD